MLKVVVFDGGYGGELFADLLEKEMPVIEVIRVIDWRKVKELTLGAKTARQAAEEALRPYLGKVDLIILANHLLSITSLRYFRRKYAKQKFLGLELTPPKRTGRREVLILTTKAVMRTFDFWNFRVRLHARARILALDTWPMLIDDGELRAPNIEVTMEVAEISRQKPRDIILACATFNDIKGELRSYFDEKVRIYDSFDRALKMTCKMLKIRGGLGRKS